MKRKNRVNKNPRSLSARNQSMAAKGQEEKEQVQQPAPETAPPEDRKPAAEGLPETAPPTEEKPAAEPEPEAAPPAEEKPAAEPEPEEAPPTEEKPAAEPEPEAAPPAEEKPAAEPEPEEAPPTEEKPAAEPEPEEAPPAEETEPVSEEAILEEARKSAAYQIAHKKIGRQKMIRIAVYVLLSFVLCGVMVAAFLFYVKSAENKLEVTFYHLQSDAVGEPFRIVQLSDLHMHEFGEKNKELVDWVKRLNPDIIAITGDMNNDFDPNYSVVIDLCEQLVEITDVYYVMGNHEWVEHIDRHTPIKDDIVATGVHMLQNGFLETEVNGNKLVIGGLVNEVKNYYNYSGPKFMESFMETEGFKILLVHYPEYFLGTLNNYSIDLAMCGHVHGGVVRILHFGGVYASDQGFLPELSEGMQRVEGGSVVVLSRGLGGEGIIPRINNNPEIVVVDVSWY